VIKDEKAKKSIYVSKEGEIKDEKAKKSIYVSRMIAILAIILLIAVPSILGIIEEAKIKSFKLSVMETVNLMVGGY